MTTPLIEAIARAICANTGGFAWECAPDDTKDGCLGDAQAALTAITEAGYQLTRVIDEDEVNPTIARLMEDGA